LGINHRPRFAICCIFCSLLFVLLLTNLRPAAAQVRAPTMHIEVDLQPVEVQVKDAHGNDVSGLSAKDFTVLENGKPQKIAFFDAGKGPVSIVVLVDSSNSVSSDANLGSAQAIAAQFMRMGHPGDEISAMDFTDQMGPFQHLTPEQLLNPSTVSLASAPSSGSALYDAIASALCHLRSSKNPRQAIIVITDGIDQHSRISLQQLIGLVRSSRAQLFMIGLQSRSDFHFQGHAASRLTLISGHDIDNPVFVFRSLMTESGAESFIPKSQTGLNEALKAVSSMLQSEYTLAYYPHRTSKNVRKIEVKVDRRGVHVLARRFVDPEQTEAESVHFDQPACTVSPKFHPYPYESKVTRGATGIVYHEDFSDPRSGWPIHKESHYVAGGYELVNPKVEVANSGQLMTPGDELGGATTSQTITFQPYVIAAYGPWWSDFDASVNMEEHLEKVSPGASAEFLQNSSPAAGLLFRMTIGGYYALLVSNSANPDKLSVELVRRDRFGDSYSDVPLIPWTTVNQPPSSVVVSFDSVSWWRPREIGTPVAHSASCLSLGTSCNAYWKPGFFPYSCSILYLSSSISPGEHVLAIPITFQICSISFFKPYWLVSH
jgi:Ca-activated chloride channel homolog